MTDRLLSQLFIMLPKTDLLPFTSYCNERATWTSLQTREGQKLPKQAYVTLRYLGCGDELRERRMFSLSFLQYSAMNTYAEIMLKQMIFFVYQPVADPNLGGSQHPPATTGGDALARDPSGLLICQPSHDRGNVLGRGHPMLNGSLFHLSSNDSLRDPPNHV